MPSNSSARNHPEQHLHDANREESHAWEKEVPHSPTENRYNSPGYAGASWARRSDRRTEYNRWGSPLHHGVEPDRFYGQHGRHAPASWERELDSSPNHEQGAGAYRPLPVPALAQGYGHFPPQSGGYRTIHRTNYGNSGSWGGSSGAMAGAEYGRTYGAPTSGYGIGEGHRAAWQHRWPEDEYRSHNRGYVPGAEEGYTWYEEEQAARHRELDRRAAERDEYSSGHYGRKSFRGVGPKAYRRSDERIREDICDRLSEDEWLDASGIEVLVKDGEVTLNGHVDNRGLKRRVEDICESVSGVQHVQNNIRSSRDVSIK